MSAVSSLSLSFQIDFICTIVFGVVEIVSFMYLCFRFYLNRVFRRLSTGSVVYFYVYGCKAVIIFLRMLDPHHELNTYHSAGLPYLLDVSFTNINLTLYLYWARMFAAKYFVPIDQEQWFLIHVLPHFTRFCKVVNYLMPLGTYVLILVAFVENRARWAQFAGYLWAVSASLTVITFIAFSISLYLDYRTISYAETTTQMAPVSYLSNGEAPKESQMNAAEESTAKVASPPHQIDLPPIVEINSHVDMRHVRVAALSTVSIMPASPNQSGMFPSQLVQSNLKTSLQSPANSSTVRRDQQARSHNSAKFFSLAFLSFACATILLVLFWLQNTNELIENYDRPFDLLLESSSIYNYPVYLSYFLFHIFSILGIELVLKRLENE